jgi:hypothetical protein
MAPTARSYPARTVTCESHSPSLVDERPSPGRACDDVREMDGSEPGPGLAGDKPDLTWPSTTGASSLAYADVVRSSLPGLSESVCASGPGSREVPQ